MREIMNRVRALPLGIKVIMVFIPFGIFVLFLSHLFGALLDMQEKMTAVEASPDEENVSALVEHLKKSILGFNNNPNNWNKIRGIWNKVNHSSRVKTSTKKELLELFIKRGLYLNNKNIIDNYRE